MKYKDIHSGRIFWFIRDAAWLLSMATLHLISISDAWFIATFQRHFRHFFTRMMQRTGNISAINSLYVFFFYICSTTKNYSSNVKIKKVVFEKVIIYFYKRKQLFILCVICVLYYVYPHSVILHFSGDEYMRENFSILHYFLIWDNNIAQI